jgi:ABC-type polysaccharide/polyol phosphate export permease
MPALLTAPNREFFANLTRREIRGRYKGSWLGVLWTLVTPLVMMGAYTLVFTVLFQVGNLDQIPNYPVFLLTGLAFWVFFGGSLGVASVSLIGNANLVTKARFPREIVPVAAVASQVPTLAVMVGALVPIGLVITPGDRRAMLLTPVVVLGVLMLVVGVCLLVSVVNVFFRDTEHIIAALLLPWFFLTPILYQFNSFPLATDHAWTIDLLKYGNFATPFVLAMQDVLYFGRVPSAAVLIYVLVVGLVALVGGYAVFRHMQRDLAVEL